MPHISSVEVRFRDLDSLGHVNNAVYLTYFEQGRVHYFDDVLGTTVDWSERGFILARTEINFIQPIRLGDDITCELTCTRIGTKSFDLEYKLFREGDSRTEMASGVSVQVAYDYVNRQSIEMPQEWRDRIERFEHQD